MSNDYSTSEDHCMMASTYLPRVAVRATRQTSIRCQYIPRRTFLGRFFKRESKPTEPESAEHTSTEPYIDLEANLTKRLADIRTMEDLLPPGAKPGTVPTDLEQATGLERLELLGKMEGIDIFDMKPLDSSRKGTMDNPIILQSFGEEHYAGCTGHPPDSHVVRWLTMSRERPIERCDECGNVLKMEYVGPPEGHHGDPNYKEPETIENYVKPEYYWR